MGYLLLGLLFLWGLLMILKPDLMWRMDQSNSVGKDEPSDRYIKNTRIGGIVCILITAFLAVFYFL